MFYLDLVLTRADPLRDTTAAELDKDVPGSIHTENENSAEETVEQLAVQKEDNLDLEAQLQDAPKAQRIEQLIARDEAKPKDEEEPEFENLNIEIVAPVEEETAREENAMGDENVEVPAFAEAVAGNHIGGKCFICPRGTCANMLTFTERKEESSSPNGPENVVQETPATPVPRMQNPEEVVNVPKSTSFKNR